MIPAINHKAPAIKLKKRPMIPVITSNIPDTLAFLPIKIAATIDTINKMRSIIMRTTPKPNIKL